MKHSGLVGLILLICTAFAACRTYVSEEDCASYDYSDCNTEKPVSGPMNISLTINEQYPRVPVSLIQGRFEDGEVIWSDTLDVSEHAVYVDLNYYYTVRATYIHGGDTIVAIDGDEVKSSSEAICDSTCWTVSEGDADVRLK